MGIREDFADRAKQIKVLKDQQEAKEKADSTAFEARLKKTQAEGRPKANGYFLEVRNAIKEQLKKQPDLFELKPITSAGGQSYEVWMSRIIMKVSLDDVRLDVDFESKAARRIQRSKLPSLENKAENYHFILRPVEGSDIDWVWHNFEKSFFGSYKENSKEKPKTNDELIDFLLEKILENLSK